MGSRRQVYQVSPTKSHWETTLLSQVEACLNSRPMSVINDMLEPESLTPGHFLVGEPLVTVPEFNYDSLI